MRARALTIAATLLAIGCSDFDRLRIRAWLGGSDSQILVGYAYDTGEGVAVDKEAAVSWYRRAAEQGRPKAMSLLGEKYETGEGVTPDPVAACMWYRLAASAGDDRGRELLQALEPRLAPEQVRDAAARAEAWRAEH